MGGLLNGSKVGDKAKALLEKDADDYTWAAAAIGSQNAASYQLATEKPVMAIGGFNGSDPSPTLAQFKEYVADGKIHYFIAGQAGRSRRRPGQLVEDHVVDREDLQEGHRRQRDLLRPDARRSDGGRAGPPGAARRPRRPSANAVREGRPEGPRRPGLRGRPPAGMQMYGV